MACEHEWSIEADGLTERKRNRIAAIRQPPGKHFVLF
jgi:hypothetical protein